MSAERWRPIRKVSAAAIGGVLASGGLAGWAASGTIDWRVALAGALGAAVPIIVGYLTPGEGTEES